MTKLSFKTYPLCLCLLILAVLANTPAAAALQRLQVGMQAPDFTLKEYGGETRKFSALKGEKLTAIVFWSTWSAKSSVVLARMQKLHDRYRDHGFAVIAVNADEQRISEQTIAGVKDLVEKLKLGYPVMLDHGLATFSEFGVIALPSTIIVDSGRIIRFELSGYPLEGAEEMADYIAAAIEGKKVAVMEKKSRQPASSAVRAFNMALTSMKSKRTAETAEIWLKKAIDADPDFTLPRISLAKLYTQRSAGALARRELEQALTREPANVMALCELGQVALNEGKLDEARQLLDKALASADSYPECYTYSALAHGRAGEMEKALQLFEEAARLTPRDPASLIAKGKLLEEKARIQEAATAYRQALEKILQSR